MLVGVFRQFILFIYYYFLVAFLAHKIMVIAPPNEFWWNLEQKMLTFGGSFFSSVLGIFDPQKNANLGHWKKILFKEAWLGHEQKSSLRSFAKLLRSLAILLCSLAGVLCSLTKLLHSLAILLHSLAKQSHSLAILLHSLTIL